MRDEIDDTIDDESKTESRGMKKDIHLRLAVSVLFRAWVLKILFNAITSAYVTTTSVKRISNKLIKSMDTIAD